MQKLQNISFQNRWKDIPFQVSQVFYKTPYRLASTRTLDDELPEKCIREVYG